MIPLFKPHVPSEIDFSTIFQSRQFSYGRFSMRFEELLSQYFRTTKLATTGGYSSALHTVITSLGLTAGDEVIMSPMSCLVSTQPFRVHGINVVWADVNPLTGCLDPNDVVRHVTPNTKLIVHNHFCGYVGLIDEINELGRRYSIPVLDDGIECFGSQYRGQLIGNCGTDITCFSFSPARFPNTIGGGAIVVRDSELFSKLLLVRDCGIDRSRFRDEFGEISRECDVTLPGYSATMNDLNGYLGIKEMDFVDDVLSKQRRNAEKWLSILPSNVLPIWSGSSENEPNFWVFGVLVEDKQSFKREMREKGYQVSSVHFRNDHYSVFGGEMDLPGTARFMESFVALPCGWWIDENDIRL